MKPKDRTTVSGSIYSHTLPDNTQPSFSSLLEHLNSSFTLSADNFVSCFNKKIEAMRKLFPSLPHLPGPLPCTPHWAPGPILFCLKTSFLQQLSSVSCINFSFVAASYSPARVCVLYIHTCLYAISHTLITHRYKKTKQKPLSLDLTSSSSSSL